MLKNIQYKKYKIESFKKEEAAMFLYSNILDHMYFDISQKSLLNKENEIMNNI